MTNAIVNAGGIDTGTGQRYFVAMRSIYGIKTSIAAVLLSLACIVAAEAGEPLLGADEAYRMAAAGEITLIDIRSPQEWRQSGVPEGALAITMHNPQGPRAFYAAVLAAVGNDKSKPIAVMCARGNRSNWAQGFLRTAGFTKVLDMSEGMFGRGSKPGWLRRGLPVKRCQSC